jgi:hypothetical protein
MGGVYFAGRSSAWRAGMAFYHPEARGKVAVRSYLITAEQFVDVLAQETRRSPGTWPSTWRPHFVVTATGTAWAAIRSWSGSVPAAVCRW